MSDNVTELYPERTRQLRLRRVLIPLAIVLVLVVAGLSLYLFRDELDLDRVVRFFRYHGALETEGYGYYTYDAHSSNAYAAFSDGLAVGSVAGLTIYDQSGQALASASASAASPALALGDDMVLFWDVGGTVLAAAGTEGQLLNLQLDRPLLDADVSRRGEICYASAASGYRTVLTVLDSACQQRYQWFSSSQYLPMCAISDGGGQLAAIAMGQSGGEFESRLQLFSTSEEDPGPSVSLGNQMIYELDYLDSGVLCAVGEENLQFFDGAGEKRGEFSYGGAYLRDFCFCGDRVVLCTMPFQAGSRCTVTVVGPDGQAEAGLSLNEELLSLSASGSYIGLLTADRLLVCTAALAPYYETNDTAGASRSAVRSDGSAVLIGAGEARLYVP